MNSKKNFIREYVRALNNGTAALFAGAGLSIPSGGLSWVKLLEEEANAINIDPRKEQDLTTVAQYIYNESGSRQIITRLIKNYIDDNGKINKNHKLIASLPISKVWTTNYDSYIENSFIETGKTIDVKRSVNDMATEVENSEVTIYKMHGDIGAPKDVVILKDDYEIYDRKNELFTKALQNDLLNHTFLFLGFSFDDPNLQNILSKVRIMLDEQPRKHFCILKEVSENDKEIKEIKDEEERKEVFEYRHNIQQLKVKDLARYGIKAVLVKDYDEMTQLLQAIRSYYLSDKVFISGAYEKVEKFLGYTEPDAKQFASKFVKRLGERLHQENYVVKSGFGVNVGRDILRGFLNEDGRRNQKKISEDLIITPFPADMTKEEKHEYRKLMLEDCGITIVLFGNKIEESSPDLVLSDGIFDEIDVANTYKQLVIPVGSSGYVAEQIWNKRRAWNHEEIDNKFRKLGDDSISYEELVENIIDILGFYRQSIEKMQNDTSILINSENAD